MGTLLKYASQGLKAFEVMKKKRKKLHPTSITHTLSFQVIWMGRFNCTVKLRKI